MIEITQYNKYNSQPLTLRSIGQSITNTYVTRKPYCLKKTARCRNAMVWQRVAASIYYGLHYS